MAPRDPRTETIELPVTTTDITTQERLTTPDETLLSLPKGTHIKLISAGFSFFVAGVNDGSLGALIPHILQSYQISTALVAVTYITTFLGWVTASLTNSFLSQTLDLGAMLLLGAVLQVTAHILRSWLPPFGLFATTFWLVSLGQAYQDTYANTYVASVKTGAHRWLSFIHASYAGGCLVGPFVATAVASANKPQSKWNLFYACPVGLGVMNLILVVVAFRQSIGLRNTRSQQGSRQTEGQPDTANESTTASQSRTKGALREMADTVRTPVVWSLCLFFFCYLGAAITAGGWVVEYLVTVRHGTLSTVGYVPAGFNGGTFLGRLLLSEPTHRFGERRMLFIYCVLALAFQLVFWLVPNIVAASVALSFLGFFLGPLFASGVSVASKIFPEKIHSSGLSFMFVIGQAGGSLFPAVTGIIATHAGVKVLQPIMVGLIAATGVSWLLVPTDKVNHRE